MSHDFANLLRVIEADNRAFSSMVEHDPSILVQTGPLGETLLHWLAVEGTSEAVKILAQRGRELTRLTSLGTRR